MNESLAIAHSFDAAAAHYDRHAQLQQQVLARIAELLPHPQTGQHILDAGCGTGYLSHFFPAETYHLHGIDIAPAMVAQAQAKGMDAQQGDVNALPYADNSFDAVVSSLCLQWVENPKQAMAEMLRVLKPKSCGVIAVMADQTLRQLRDVFASVDNSAHMLDFYSVSQWHDMMDQQNAQILHCLPELISQHYESVKDIARGLKAIGANNKHASRARGLMTPRKWQQIEALYKERYGTQQGLPVYWEIVYMCFTKV